MSKRAKEAALKAYPETKPNHLGYYSLEYSTTLSARKGFQQGYEQAEKDTNERACDMLMNYIFEEVTPEMRDHFRKRLEEYNG